MADESPIIALVAAVAENGVIGRNGRLPWRIPSELQHFKRITMGKPLIMGRNTFASLKKPLEGRDNIILTRAGDYAPDGAIVANDADQAINTARRYAKQRGADEIMVIGGAEIYALMFPHARRIYLTRIHAVPEGDVHFPAYDASLWRESEARLQSRGPRDDHDYTLSILERI